MPTYTRNLIANICDYTGSNDIKSNFLVLPPPLGVLIKDSF